MGILQMLMDPGPMRGSDGDCAGYFLVLDDKVRVALVVVKDDVDLGVHPVVNTGVVEVTGGVAGADGWRAPHGGISYSEPASENLGQEHAVDSFGRALGEVVGVDGLAGEVGALAEHGGVLAADARVEVVLADALHHVGRGAVEEVALAQQPVHL